MEPVMTDLEERLRAARPDAADVSPDDAAGPQARAILRRVLAAQPPAHRPAAAGWRRPPRLLRAGVAAAVLAALAVAIGLPGREAGPQDASARPIALALHWFVPQPGTVLHIRSTLTSRDRTAPSAGLTQEIWQSVDNPDSQRLLTEQDGVSAESGPDGVYDPAQNTIYLNVPPGPRQREEIQQSIDLKIEAMRNAGAGEAAIARLREDGRKIMNGEMDNARKSSPAAPPAGDPTVNKVRAALQDGGAQVTGQETHAGVDAYVIQLDPVAAAEKTRGTPPGALRNVRWTLWLAASDGRPLELRIDNGPGTQAVETTTWDTYELLERPADELVTVRGAHPDARVVRDPNALEAATARLYAKG
jgi:hypothetical protein